MGLTSAVNWWEESQMRVLVLSSLVVQFLLFIFSFMRRFSIPWWIRSTMWLTYLAADALAIYGLATLFNRHKDQGHGGSSRALEVVWAPVLLIHLGGLDGFTAYNIEDNELWSRHLVTAVSQVTVAVYVFYKSWPGDGDKRLLRAAILLFVLGVLKCFTKPWALKSASINSLVSSSSAAVRIAKQKEGDKCPLENYVEQAKAFVEEVRQGERAWNGDHPPPQQHGFRTVVELVVEYLRRVAAWVQGRRRIEFPWCQCTSFDWAFPFLRGQKEEGELAQGARASLGDGDHPPSQHINPTQDPPRQSERDAQHEQNEGEIDELEEYVKIAMPSVRDPKDYEREAYGPRAALRKQMRRERILHAEAYKLFVDLSSPYRRRLSIFKYFWVLSEDKASGRAYGSVREGLAGAFLVLYTKLKTAGIPTESDLESEKGGSEVVILWLQLIMISRMVLPWAVIGLFHKSHREAYNDIDVNITYAMFCCTALVETYSTFPIRWMALPENPGNMLISLLLGKEQWPEKVAQYSLIGYFARNKKHSWIMWTVSLFRCKEFLDQRCCMSPSSKSRKITGLVLRHLKAGWKGGIQDATSYRRFNDSRGHWALKGNQDLGWSIKGPFDESVLLWHIATDLCFFSRSVSEHKCAFAEIPSIWSDLVSVLCPTVHMVSVWKRDTASDQETRFECGELAACKATLCRQMSNYMTYLLFVNPEMLLPGTRRNLFTAAYKELKKILDDGRPSQRKPAPVKEKEIMERLITAMEDKTREVSEEESNKGSEEGSKGGSKGSFIDDVWTLAQGLLKLKDDEMWEVIKGVWVEMLCFSAGRCRGYLHAKFLSSGGEFLSYVWLLMSYMGMETFTERLQREELPSRREENNNADPPASDAHNGTAPFAPKIHNRAGAAPSTSEVHIDMF